jgi:carotenoid cleavage dioxygenase-like enzyme
VNTPKPYISGHYTPVADEISATGLTVRGAIPPELEGRYIRNRHMFQEAS